jgi:hypothetical protein
MGFKDAVKHSVDELLHHGDHTAFTASTADTTSTAAELATNGTAVIDYTELLAQMESLLKGSPVFKYFVYLGEDFQHASHYLIDLLPLKSCPQHYAEAVSITIQVLLWMLFFALISVMGSMIEEVFSFIFNKKSELSTLKETNANLAQSLRMLIDKQSRELQILTQAKVKCERQRDVLEEELQRIMSQLGGNGPGSDSYTSTGMSMNRGSVDMGKVPIGNNALRRKSSTYTANLEHQEHESGSGMVDRSRQSIASASLASTIERNKLVRPTQTENGNNTSNGGQNGLLARVWGAVGYMPSASSLGCVPKD